MAQGEENGVGQRFLVKLLSGPHAGAEVELDEHDSRLRIGSGNDADLVLADALVNAEHAEIFLEGGSLYVKVLGGPVFVDGKRISGDEAFALQNFQFITIGVTHFITGPADGEWPQISAQDAPHLDVEEGNATNDEAPAKSRDSISVGIDQVKMAKDKRQSKTMRRVGLFFAILIILLLGLFVIAMLPKKKRISPLELEKTLQAQIADMNYISTVTLRKDREQFVVEGYVPTNMEVRELRTVLMSIYPGIHFNVRSTEKITETLEEMLRTIEGTFRVIPIQPGVFSVIGYTLNGDAWQALRMRLLSDVAGVKKIRNDVMTPDKVVSVTQDILASNGLREVVAEPEAMRIFFHGKISVLQTEQWKVAAETLIQTFSDIIPVEFDVQTFSAQTETAISAFFPTQIQAITVGSRGLSWITTVDGKKYFPGSFLPSGWRVDSIEIGGLRLGREGKQVNMRLEELQ
ncbi:MAG: type III secretion system inner membrane ring subunit SctD [Puniceicoccales bacterium]|jgi:type III secretion system YscD/HrpQ family protein|nr:type III secretion system inner membrane ring subunit SctD [Puniceicoccales bacterium]